jgi:hypothetical protein
MVDAKKLAEALRKLGWLIPSSVVEKAIKDMEGQADG